MCRSRERWLPEDCCFCEELYENPTLGVDLVQNRHHNIPVAENCPFCVMYDFRIAVVYYNLFMIRSHRGCDRMVVGFTTTCATSAYHHQICEFESHSWRGVLYTTLCDKVCQWLPTGL